MAADERVIRLKLRSVEQLFNSLDPSPFVGRDLDPAAESFIVDWAAEHPRTGAFKLEVMVEQVAAPELAQERLSAALQSYFGASVAATEQQFRRLMRQGRFSLLVGLAFLIACFGVSDLLQQQVPHSRAVDFISEGLLIVCWVAMWQPLQIFLYEWWPLRRHRQLLQRLAAMSVVIKTQ